MKGSHFFALDCYCFGQEKEINVIKITIIKNFHFIVVINLGLKLVVLHISKYPHLVIAYYYYINHTFFKLNSKYYDVIRERRFGLSTRKTVSSSHSRADFSKRLPCFVIWGFIINWSLDFSLDGLDSLDWRFGLLEREIGGRIFRGNSELSR